MGENQKRNKFWKPLFFIYIFEWIEAYLLEEWLILKVLVQRWRTWIFFWQWTLAPPRGKAIEQDSFWIHVWSSHIERAFSWVLFVRSSVSSTIVGRKFIGEQWRFSGWHVFLETFDLDKWSSQDSCVSTTGTVCGNDCDCGRLRRYSKDFTWLSLRFDPHDFCFFVSDITWVHTVLLKFDDDYDHSLFFFFAFLATTPSKHMFVWRCTVTWKHVLSR